MTHCATEKAVEVCFDTKERKGVPLPDDSSASSKPWLLPELLQPDRLHDLRPFRLLGGDEAVFLGRPGRGDAADLGELLPPP